MVLLSLTIPAHAEELSIGFPEFSKRLNILTSDHPIAFFVRSATTGALTRRHTPVSDLDSEFRLNLADNMNVTPDFTKWSFRIKPGAAFHNGQPITGKDAVFSLKLCQKRGELPQHAKFSSRQLTGKARLEESWVDIELDKAKIDAELPKTMPMAMATCPVFERRTSLLFGEDFGSGSNMVSAGDYNIVDFYSGKQLRLQRIYIFGKGRAGAQAIELRGFKDSKHGLTALRMGTIDALFTENQEVLKKARADETLGVSSCRGFTVVNRKGLFVPCKPDLNVALIKYVS